MRGMAYETYGGTEVLRDTRLPVPKFGPGEVLVRVKYASVNPVDWKIMAGGLDALMDVVYPVVPCWDVSGTVEKVGIDTPEFAEGDEVMAYARKDYVHGGTCAEFVTVPVRALARKPASLGWAEAAGLPLAGLTAYQVLTRLGTGKDDTVLIHGAAGGVGSFGVQIARALGARVIGTASPRNHDRVRELGAEPVAYGDGLAERVLALVPDGATVVADFVGGVLDVTRRVLHDDGRHASIADPTVTGSGGEWMWVRPVGSDLAALGQLTESGQLTVPVARTFPLGELAAAFELSQGGHTAGKIVIEV
ncbi:MULTISPECIES: NADP-dependent oxidoreductase [unclassified Streptomyces]|uniref:NADP-dependent oxidoreductase n=1 Tax=unclassified Streptomyces TaxID=2593676 RepID=UPI00214AE1DA|nr:MULTISPECIES: NADP-dependent oxidoreductase [unclassified Streptomyces]MCX5015683.1 NADP-dependent oxidoreductase [Streptomyces sp. NBC_00555]MCX5609677.1 NADP-dependent oxidoreductase [Streptomyces sp. NBC_00047]UUU44843.1 NADP-dependent oxidoreductase [Streptomyces sp. NBC_00162]